MKELKNVPQALGKKTVLKTEFDTADIIRAMEMTQERFKKYQTKFCQWANDHFEPTVPSLRKLWHAVRFGIRYQIDPEGVQHVKTPLALVELGQGDCKSKTVFVNTVLQCLGIKYTTRYASYDRKDSTVKHVYTIAHLNGQNIIIDAVYHTFGREKRYQYKEDYPMPELAIIEGVEQRPMPVLHNGPGVAQYHPNRTQQGCAPDRQTELYLEAKANMLKVRERIQQKKAYVPTFQDVPFHKLNEGQASLALLERELEIIRVMQPQLATECQKGLNMLYQAKEKGVYAPTGAVSPFLVRYAQQIQAAQRNMHPANSHGLIAQYIYRNRTRNCTPQQHYVGSTGVTQCLDRLWSERKAGTIDNFATPADSNTCSLAPVYPLINYNYTPGDRFVSLYQDRSTQYPFNHLTTAAEIQAYRNDLFYSYGVQTPHKVSLLEYGGAVYTQLSHAVATGRISKGRGSAYTFQSQADFQALLVEINQNSGVASNWLNHTFKTDAQQDASVGSGLYYDFADSIPGANGAVISTNSLPVSVLSKMGFQAQFINSCTNFSGVSRANVRQLTRLGVLFDAEGYSPEQLLHAGYQQYSGAVSGHNVGFLDPATLTAIIVAVIAAVAAGVSEVAGTVIKANQEASSIDTDLSTASNFQPPAANQMPLQEDWSRSGNSGSGGNGSGSNNTKKEGGSMLPWLIGGVAVAAAVMSK